MITILTLLSLNYMTRDPSIRIVLLPKDTNKHGTIFGGIILSYIDLAGIIEISRRTDQKVVTVLIKEVIFKYPVYVGEIVSFYCNITKIGKTSISLHVDVEVEKNFKSNLVTQADLTYCAVDNNGKPEPIVLKYEPEK